MTNTININADAPTAASSTFTTLNWKRTGGFVRPTVYGFGFVVINFLLIIAVSYDYAMAGVA